MAVEVPDPKELPTISVPEAGALLGLKRAAAYKAAKRGDIPTIPVGKGLRVPTARFVREQLGAERNGDELLGRQRLAEFESALNVALDNVETAALLLAETRSAIQGQLTAVRAARAPAPATGRSLAAS